MLGRLRMLTCSAGLSVVRFIVTTELAKKVCPGLRDSACCRSGEITQTVGHTFLANSVHNRVQAKIRGREGRRRRLGKEGPPPLRALLLPSIMHNSGVWLRKKGHSNHPSSNLWRLFAAAGFGFGENSSTSLHSHPSLLAAMLLQCEVWSSNPTPHTITLRSFSKILFALKEEVAVVVAPFWGLCHKSELRFKYKTSKL